MNTDPATNIPPLEWTPELIKRFWDYQSIYGTHHYFAKMVSKALIRRVKKHLAGDPSILDYGCGPGYLVETLLKRNYRVFGYDASPHSIKVAQERLSRHPRLLGLSSEAASKNAYDVIFALELIEHLSDAALEAALSDLRVLLSPGGRLILTTPYKEDLEEGTVYCPQCNHLFHRMQHVRSWSEETLRQYLSQRGFEVVELIVTDLTACYSRRPWVRLRYWLGWTKPTNLIAVCRFQRSRE